MFRFRVAARNELGLGVYSDEIRLMATNAPDTPSLSLVAYSRTLTGFQLSFGAPTSAGGAPLLGYVLYQDEGIAGSPFGLIFNGTTMPEIISYKVSNLTTALNYTFKLYAANQRFVSTTPAILELQAGTLADKPQLL